jgi:hypothetical protein
MSNTSTSETDTSGHWVAASTPGARIYIGPPSVITEEAQRQIDEAAARVLAFERQLLSETPHRPLVVMSGGAR